MVAYSCAAMHSKVLTLCNSSQNMAVLQKNPSSVTVLM